MWPRRTAPVRPFAVCRCRPIAPLSCNDTPRTSQQIRWQTPSCSARSQSIAFRSRIPGDSGRPPLTASSRDARAGSRPLRESWQLKPNPCTNSGTPRSRTGRERVLTDNGQPLTLGKTSRAACPSPPYSFAGILIYSNPHRSDQARGFPIGALPPRTSRLGRGGSTRRSPRWPPRAGRVAS